MLTLFVQRHSQKAFVVDRIAGLVIFDNIRISSASQISNRFFRARRFELTRKSEDTLFTSADVAVRPNSNETLTVAAGMTVV